MSRLRLAGCSLTVAMVLATMLGGPASARTPELLADLDGLAIEPRTAGLYYCHDFDHPVIHCFRTAASLEAAVSLRTAAPLEPNGVNGALAVSYVRVFDYATYAGPYAYLSQDYSRLSDIGWDNKISSYIALNSETGAFYTNAGWGGSVDFFCCNEGVSSLSSTFNNQISSARRT